MTPKQMLNSAWNEAGVGAIWLKQLFEGEFAENRPRSVIIADMLASCAPGLVVVISMRDLAAVVLRLSRRYDGQANPQEMQNHPEWEEWVLLVGNLIPLILPVIGAAVGAAGAGVGALAGALIGDEASAFLRALCVLLIKESEASLRELVAFFSPRVRGNVVALLRQVHFAAWGDPLIAKLDTLIANVRWMLRQVQGRLGPFGQFGHALLARLEAFETKFYAVQKHALTQIPNALKELDARLAHALSESWEAPLHVAYAGVPAVRPAPLAMSESVHVSAGIGTPSQIVPKPTAGSAAHLPSRPHGQEVPLPKRPRLEPGPNVHVNDGESPLPSEPPKDRPPQEEPPSPEERLKAPEKDVPCFKGDKLPGAKHAEMDRQLGGQQAGLNEMTVQEYLDGRDAYMVEGRGDPAVAREARAKHQAKLRNDLARQYQGSGMSVVEAEKRAMTEAAEQMKTLAALHNPDQVAAGANVIRDFGDRQVNSTIGGQWASPLKGGRPQVSRVQLLDNAARDIPIAQRASTLMNVRLHRCE